MYVIFAVQRFSFEEIANMTRHFDGRNVKEGGSLIDEGGFGVVFKGRFSGDEPCAVKKLKEVRFFSSLWCNFIFFTCNAHLFKLPSLIIALYPIFV